MAYSQKPTISARVIIPTADDPFASEFERLSNCLQVVRTSEFTQAWLTYVRALPQTLYDRLTLGFPYSTTVFFNINIDGSGYIKIKVIDGLREIAEADRTFSIATREAFNHAFAIWKPEDRGIGIARALLRNTFSLYKDWGIELVRCSAGLEDGAYTWARYGFKVSPAEWADLQPQLISRLYSLPLSWQDQQEIAQLINLNDPMGLWFVSDLAGSVEISEAVGCGKTRTCSIGRALLEGLNWKGFFEFGDADCVKRFERRIEGAL